MKVVPALLTDNKDEFLKMIDICRGFTDYVQVDIMDGEFVPSASITLDELTQCRSSIGSEAHLMVEDPIRWIVPFKQFGADRIIFHHEMKRKNHAEVIEKIRENGLSAGLAVNPSTPIDDFKGLIPDLDMVLFMSVIPGFYGSQFIPEVLDKIRTFKSLFPQTIAAIDGGVKLDNAKEIIRSGVDYLCVGSALLKADPPQDAYRQFRELTHG
ncbi:MAG: ribulose-phosphate 3-epimerase [Candidatus Omnitrophica bacterium]|nr:ribulose-phosphate 3-epimerase [Candidatus Omnitrophota bacterium]